MKRKCSNKDDELNLLLAFVQGDPKAAKMFFEKYGGIIKHAVGKADIYGNVIDREDLFQDVITYILNDDMKIVQDFRSKCKFSTYLYTICRRYAIKMVSRESKIHSGDEDLSSLAELPIALIDQTEIWDEDQKKALHKAIEKLDEDSQIFIRMMYYDIRPTSEIMIFFGWNSPNSVYSKKNKIIARLRKMTRKMLEN